MNPKVLIYTFILLVAAIIYFKFIAGTKTAFDKSKWLSQTGKRFEMADDIIESKMLIGKDSNQVKEILGEPEWSSPFPNRWSFSYTMGWEVVGFGGILHTLLLKFEDGKVKEVADAKAKD